MCNVQIRSSKYIADFGRANPLVKNKKRYHHQSSLGQRCKEKTYMPTFDSTFFGVQVLPSQVRYSRDSFVAPSIRIPLSPITGPQGVAVDS